MHLVHFGVASGICICSGSSSIRTLSNSFVIQRRQVKPSIYFTIRNYFLLFALRMDWFSFLTTFVLMIRTKGLRKRTNTNPIYSLCSIFYPFLHKEFENHRRFSVSARQKEKRKTSPIIMMIITKQKDLNKMIIRIIGWEFIKASKSSLIWFELGQARVGTCVKETKRITKPMKTYTQTHIHDYNTMRKILME